MPAPGHALAPLGAAVLVAGAGMIDRTEILRLASELGLGPRVVEKDYVLGWVLAGIARDEELSRAWLFKGGTCLKKCFFETYRFSEDLDFTVTEPAQLDREFLLARFKALGAWLYDVTGIELPAELLRFDVWDQKTGGRAGEGRLAYRGPIAPRGGDLPRIKLDLTADERVVLPSVIARRSRIRTGRCRRTASRPAAMPSRNCSARKCGRSRSAPGRATFTT